MDASLWRSKGECMVSGVLWSVAGEIRETKSGASDLLAARVLAAAFSEKDI